MHRRKFLQQTTIATTALTLAPLVTRAASGANDRVRVAVIGCNGRGLAHINGFLSVPNVEVAYVCDVDKRAVEKGVAQVKKKQERAPQGVGDLRRILEDSKIDAVSIATPDHWHAPAAILACAAGKHVYVEKPGSHNLHESELLVTAARKHRRVVQMGNQRRSWPWVREAMNALHSGELGSVYFARAWYTNKRGTIGRGQPAPVPDWLDYSLWQGPAPERAFRDNVIHYNWHWFWHWGTGELGNNGVHALDLARWGLGVTHPRRATCTGGRYHFQDDWEPYDTCVATFDFGTCGASWQGQSCDSRGFDGAGFGVTFLCEKGSLVIAGDNCVIYDPADKVVREIKGRFDDSLHFANFIGAIRAGEKLNSEIEEGQRSTALCHLGNIAWRTGHALDVDPATGKILHDKAAIALTSRDYRKGWEPRV